MSNHEHPANGENRATTDATIHALWSDERHVAEETMHALLDGELSPEDNQKVLSHFDVCKRCAREQRDVAELRAMVARTLSTGKPQRSSEIITPTTIRRRATRSSPTQSGSIPKTRNILEHAAVRIVPGAVVREPRFGKGARAVIGLSIGLAVATGGAIYALSHRNTHSQSPTAVTMADTPKSVAVQTAAPKGSLSNVHKTDTARTEIPLPTPTPYTASGTVVTPRGNNVKLAIGGAQVFIPGTNVATTTDSFGHFTLRIVPASATSIEVRHAVGFMRGSSTIVLHNHAFADVTIAVHQSLVTLNSVQANDAGRLDVVSTTKCLVTMGNASQNRPRIFTALRGAIVDAGEYRLDVTDWPHKGTATNAAFALDADGVLHGSAKATNARLGLVLTRRDHSWVGTVSEERIGSSRSEPVMLQPQSNASRCGW